MIANKHITKIVAVIMALAVCLCLCAIIFSDQLLSAAGGAGVMMEYEAKLFDTSKIISINILMDDADWTDMLANATAEEYYQCDVEINGESFYRVGIRPKGNTSLSFIASDPDNDRYSFKLDFDQFVDGQTCYGLDKLVLNNNFADATNMKEALIYDMFHFIGADASLYNYAEISVNGEYWGVYLALEAVEDSFILRNYGTENGELYKPDSMDMGGGSIDNKNRDFGNVPPVPTGEDNTAPKPPQTGKEVTDDFERTQYRNISASNAAQADLPEWNANMPAAEGPNAGGSMGGFGMGGNGANLNYSNDDLDSYSAIWQGEVTNTSESDHKRVVIALKNISQGTNLERYMDVDNLLKYAAVHIFSVNADSLSGNMAHNYYLYEADGKLNILPWDYNLALGGMGGMGDTSGATSTVNDAIDNAFSSTNFFDALLADEEYHAQYYAYMQQLVDEYLLGEGFQIFYSRTRTLIDELVKRDPNALYSYEEYEIALATFCEVVELRGKSIDGQLNGTMPSTENEQGNSDTLIDASHLDLSVMGSMGGAGGGGRDDRNRDRNPGMRNESTPEMTEANAAPNQATGNTDDRAFNEQIPEGVDPPQFGEQVPGNTQPGNENADNRQQPQGNFDAGNIPATNEIETGAFLAETLITYGICFVLLIAASKVVVKGECEIYLC